MYILISGTVGLIVGLIIGFIIGKNKYETNYMGIRKHSKIKI